MRMVTETLSFVLPLSNFTFTFAASVFLSKLAATCFLATFLADIFSAIALASMTLLLVPQDVKNSKRTHIRKRYFISFSLYLISLNTFSLLLGFPDLCMILQFPCKNLVPFHLQLQSQSHFSI